MQYHIWDCPLLELLDPSRKLSRLGLPIDVAACYPTHLSSGSYSDYRANPSSKTLRDIVIYPICAPDLYARLDGRQKSEKRIIVRRTIRFSDTRRLRNAIESSSFSKMNCTDSAAKSHLKFIAMAAQTESTAL